MRWQKIHLDEFFCCQNKFNVITWLVVIRDILSVVL